MTKIVANTGIYRLWSCSVWYPGLLSIHRRVVRVMYASIPLVQYDHFVGIRFSSDNVYVLQPIHVPRICSSEGKAVIVMFRTNPRPWKDIHFDRTRLAKMFYFSVSRTGFCKHNISQLLQINGRMPHESTVSPAWLTIKNKQYIYI